MACTCIKKQVGKGKGKVQGFVVTLCVMNAKQLE